jgi:hypothetical protein
MNAGGDGGEVASAEAIHAISSEKMTRQGVAESLLHASTRLDHALGV